MNIQIGDQKLFFGHDGSNQRIINEIARELGYSNLKLFNLSGASLSKFVSKIESIIELQLSKLEGGSFRVKEVFYKGNAYQISLSGKANTDLYFLIRLHDKITANQVYEISVDTSSTSPSN